MEDKGSFNLALEKAMFPFGIAQPICIPIYRFRFIMKNSMAYSPFAKIGKSWKG